MRWYTGGLRCIQLVSCKCLFKVEKLAEALAKDGWPESMRRVLYPMIHPIAKFNRLPQVWAIPWHGIAIPLLVHLPPFETFSLLYCPGYNVCLHQWICQWSFRRELIWSMWWVFSIKFMPTFCRCKVTQLIMKECELGDGGCEVIGQLICHFTVLVQLFFNFLM